MKLLALDLEFNQPSQKIIQIGAVIGSSEGELLVKFSQLVNPGEGVSAYITGLTSIDDGMLKDAPPLVEAYRRLCDLVDEYKPFCNPITWGGGDSVALLSQLPEGVRNIFGRRWIDVKTLHIAERMAMGLPPQGGLAKVMTRYGLRFDGQKHNALDDAYNTYRLYVHLLNQIRKGKG